MGIYISNLKIPKDEYLPINIYPDGGVACRFDANCANAIEIPPHGDLIEKSVIEKAFNDACAECRDSCIEFDGFLADCDQCIFRDVKKALVDAPTIIKAKPPKEET